MRAAGRWGAMLVAGVLASIALSGCRAPHPGVSNGSVSACYRAIPTARAAANDRRAVLIGVHRIPVDQVQGHLPPAAQAEISIDNDTVVCAVSLKGKFGPGQVFLAPPNEQGQYALVLISSRHLHVLASAVLTELPKTFAGRTL